MVDEYGKQDEVEGRATGSGSAEEIPPSARILVVDDEQSIRHFVSRALADSGHEVTTAATGAEAMRLFHAEAPDLVVLDVRLPDAMGLDLLTQMKAEAPGTEVIVITAVDQVETAVKDITVSVRIISATNQNLEKRVKEGAFREDLFYRLKVVPIYVPPLRERREDIMPLALHFMGQFNKAFKKGFTGVHVAAEKMLHDYPWPGNIRELRNLMERTVLLEAGPELLPAHLHFGAVQGPSRTEEEPQDALLSRIAEILRSPGIPAAGIPTEELLEELEKALILKAAAASNGNQSKAAELLRMKRDKLRYRMKVYDLRAHPNDDGEIQEQTGT